jgi:tetrahydromethanopterin S-methyltransferase subunit G
MAPRREHQFGKPWHRNKVKPDELKEVYFRLRELDRRLRKEKENGDSTQEKGQQDASATQ